MAKCNDGNLLQHCIEVELAVAMSGDGPLHLFATHGMAPFEPRHTSAPQKKGKPRSAHKLFDYWLRQSGLHYPLDGLPAVLRAYRAVGSSWSRYANSGELLRGALGAKRVAGFVCEVVPKKAEEIARRLLQPDWKGTTLEVRPGSWRTSVKDGLPATASSWLFTMDPMQYKAGNAADDAFVYRDDLELVRDKVEPLLDGPHTGAVAIFSYTTTPEVVTAFETAMTEVFGAGRATFISTTARGGNKHVAAVVSNRPASIHAAARAWESLKEKAKQGA